MKCKASSWEEIYAVVDSPLPNAFPKMAERTHLCQAGSAACREQLHLSIYLHIWCGRCYRRLKLSPCGNEYRQGPAVLLRERTDLDAPTMQDLAFVKTGPAKGLRAKNKNLKSQVGFYKTPPDFESCRVGLWSSKICVSCDVRRFTGSLE